MALNRMVCTFLVEPHSEVEGGVPSFVWYQHATVMLQEFVDGECLARDTVLAGVVERSVALLIHAISLKEWGEGGRLGDGEVQYDIVLGIGGSKIAPTFKKYVTCGK